MIIWTSVLVLGLGAVSFFVMVQPPRSLTMKSAGAKKKLRTPASAKELTALAVAPDKNQVIDLQLECDQPAVEFPSTISQVRLIGKACGQFSDFATTEIRNEANGYAATVFYPREGTFSSDYVTLSDGANKIRILHVFKRGGREERGLVINRQKEISKD